jgi:hypothetical protein
VASGGCSTTPAIDHASKKVTPLPRKVSSSSSSVPLLENFINCIELGRVNDLTPLAHERFTVFVTSYIVMICPETNPQFIPDHSTNQRRIEQFPFFGPDPFVIQYLCNVTC